MDLESTINEGQRLREIGQYTLAGACLQAAFQGQCEQGIMDVDVVDGLLDCWKQTRLECEDNGDDQGALECMNNSRKLLKHVLDSAPQANYTWNFDLAEIEGEVLYTLDNPQHINTALEHVVSLYQTGCQRIEAEIVGADDERRKELKADYCAACCSAAEVLLGQGDNARHDVIEQWFNRCLACDGDFIDLYRLRASVRHDQNRSNEAKADASRALALLRAAVSSGSAPTYDEVIELGKMHLTVGSIQEASETFQIALSLSEDSAYAWYLNGVAFKMLDDWKGAGECMLRAKKLCDVQEIDLDCPLERDFKEVSKKCRQMNIWAEVEEAAARPLHEGGDSDEEGEWEDDDEAMSDDG